MICDVTPDDQLLTCCSFADKGIEGTYLLLNGQVQALCKQHEPVHFTVQGGEQNNSSSAGCHSLVRLVLTAANHERNLVVWWYKFHCPRDVATKITPPCPCDVAGSSRPADQLTIAARCVPKVMRPCLSLNLFLQK